MFLGTSGIWEVSNHNAVYTSGSFTKNRINSDCGGCFDLYTDFLPSEIINAGNSPGFWLRDEGGAEIRGIGISRLIEVYEGASGVYHTASGIGQTNLHPLATLNIFLW